jgi:hypothetical protein
VLKAANHDSRDVLLVYASDQAILPNAAAPLPEPLETFVKVDNRLFREERGEAIAEAEASDTAANANAMDTSWGNAYPDIELPPAYDPQWTSASDAKGYSETWQPEPQPFVPDPGEKLVSDAEYQLNTNPRFAPQDAAVAGLKYPDPLLESIGYPTPARTAGVLSPDAVAAPKPSVQRKAVGASGSVGAAGGSQRQAQAKGGAEYIEDVEMV